MTHFDIFSSIGRFQRATARLREKWAEAQSQWNDQTSRDFEKAYLQPLPARITLTVAAIQKMADVLQQAVRDLEDREG